MLFYSEGDYVDSNAAGSYANNYKDYQQHLELGSVPSNSGGQRPGDDYMYQSAAPNHNAEPQLPNEDYLERSSYRTNSASDPPLSNHEEALHAGQSDLKASQDPLMASREFLYNSQNLANNSRDQVPTPTIRNPRTESSDQLYKSQEHLTRSREKDLQAMHDPNQGHSE